MDLTELRAIEKRIMSSWLAGNTKKIVTSTKNYVIKPPSEICIKMQQAIKCITFPMWDILLSTTKDCFVLTKTVFLEKQIKVKRWLFLKSLVFLIYNEEKAHRQFNTHIIFKARKVEYNSK